MRPSTLARMRIAPTPPPMPATTNAKVVFSRSSNANEMPIAKSDDGVGELPAAVRGRRHRAQPGAAQPQLQLGRRAAPQGSAETLGDGGHHRSPRRARRRRARRGRGAELAAGPVRVGGEAHGETGRTAHQAPYEEPRRDGGQHGDGEDLAVHDAALVGAAANTRGSSGSRPIALISFQPRNAMPAPMQITTNPAVER